MWNLLNLVLDAVIGHVSACEIEEKPTETKTEPSLKELKAHAENILKYCMEKDTARVEKKERDAYTAKVERIIEEMSDYLKRKCIYKISYVPSSYIWSDKYNYDIEKEKGSGGTTETEKHVSIHCMYTL